MPSDPGYPRHALLIGLLAFTSGCVDVVTLMALGGAFTSVITGNLVFIGRAIGTSSLTPALDAVMAVVGYMAGVAIGSRLAHLNGRPATSAWPRRATVVLAVESAVLLAVNAAWICYRGTPPARATDVMLIAAAVSLGMQGAAARAVAGTPSTTYMTGALTALIEAVATGRGRGADLSAVAGLAALIAGAACGAVLVEHARLFALLPPLAAVAAVVAIKLVHHKTERRAEPVLSGARG